MRVAIAGFGVAGAARLSAYRRVVGADVVAVIDPSPERRAHAAALDGRIRQAASLEQALDGGPIDLVDICAPPVFHAPLAVQAMEAGCHVLCEKPVGLDVEESLRMVACARRTGRMLYPVFNYVYSPMMRTLAKAATWLREPVNARFEIRRTTHAAGTPGWRPDWRRDPAVAGGGILLDHGTHCVYMATRLLGGVPYRVTCTTRDGAGGLDETVSARLDFARGTCVIELSWAGTERRNLYRLDGANGSIAIDDDRVLIETPSGTETAALTSPTASGTHEEWFPDLFADLLTHLERPGGEPDPLEEILSTARVVEAAYASAVRAGEPVEPV
ncbi:Gfo/Idh/MocA family oxidoreductase [Nonomuraea longicatena]|uniref:Gfo/Idh/MocA family oxidoreductase n=1 Tax=Nonomuraea longicatena TaxID=83682 RepID=A0ABP4AHV4_9ACTN